MSTLDRAAADQGATIFAFGHRYTHDQGRDPTWGFTPEDGVHNIHLNQGFPRGDHDNENGRDQDGALWIQFGNGTWTALYFAFEEQSWDNGPDGFPVAVGG